MDCRCDLSYCHSYPCNLLTLLLPFFSPFLRSVILLPTVNPSMIAPGVIPLLVFVNVRAGGGQGMQLKQSFRKLLNPHQVSLIVYQFFSQLGNGE